MKRSPYFLLASAFCFGVLLIINNYARPGESDRKELTTANNLVSSGEGNPAKLKRAQKITERLLVRDPLNINALFVQGWADQRLGQPNEAISRYTTLLQQVRELGKFASFNSGLLHEDRGDTYTALQLYLDAAHFDPRFEAAWVRIILVLRKLKRDEEAAATLEEALFHLPQSTLLLEQRSALGLPTPQ